MDKNVIYITDSSILNNAQEFSFYSIISLCGSYESIETFACHFNDIFKSLVLSKKSFSEWFKSEDNSDTLLHFLSNIDKKNLDCKFIAYLSDHDFSKFALYLNTYCSINNNTDLIKNIDLLYQKFNKSLLHSINKDISEDKLVEINNHFLSLLNILSKEAKKEILSSTTTLERQKSLILEMSKTIYTDLSMADYLQYSLSLFDIVNEFKLNSIYATEHSASNINICVDAHRNISKNNYNVLFDNLVTSSIENNLNILLNNIVVIFDYVWNQLHNSDSLDKWSEKEKLLTIYLWLLFQSNYSRWMITPKDFSKIKQILEDLK